MLRLGVLDQETAARETEIEAKTCELDILLLSVELKKRKLESLLYDKVSMDRETTKKYVLDLTMETASSVVRSVEAKERELDSLEQPVSTAEAEVKVEQEQKLLMVPLALLPLQLKPLPERAEAAA